MRRLAQAVIWAAPVFQAPKVFPELSPGLAAAIGEFQYAPWLVANLSLRGFPEERRGAPLSWDNVLYDSPALGYVVATHMSLRTRIDRSVWTWYHALAGGDPARNRAMMLGAGWNYFAEYILRDLERAHRDIRECVSRIDVLRIGHAMARPVPGFLGSESRRRWASLSGRILYANSDLSGFSIFEEAQYRGVRSADRAMRILGRG